MGEMSVFLSKLVFLGPEIGSFDPLTFCQNPVKKYLEGLGKDGSQSKCEGLVRVEMKPLPQLQGSAQDHCAREAAFLNLAGFQRCQAVSKQADPHTGLKKNL